jgi:hypothetical protein
VEVTIRPATTAVTLLARGVGLRAPLRYAPVAGSKRAVELALDFASAEKLGEQASQMAIPTIVLRGEAEATAVAADGRASFTISMASAGARDVAGSRISTAEMQAMVASLAGLVIRGSHAATGAAGETTLRVERSDQLTSGALEIVRLTLPVLPLLPVEPVGVGARWRATTELRLADKIAVQQVTDYELVSAAGTTWTIRGKTSIRGADQELPDGKITNIQGTGASELTLAAGAALPVYQAALDTSFTASSQGESMTLTLRVKGAVTAPDGVSAPAPSPAPTPTPAAPRAPPVK